MSTITAKRENAKAKGIEMKMNNIEHLNGQINDLLNMVKKDSLAKSAKNKNKNINERSFSPSPHKKYDNRKGVSPDPKLNAYDTFQGLYRERLKTHSGYSVNSDSLNELSKKDFERYNRQNEEDRHYYHKDYIEDVENTRLL